MRDTIYIYFKTRHDVTKNNLAEIDHLINTISRFTGAEGILEHDIH